MPLHLEILEPETVMRYKFLQVSQGDVKLDIWLFQNVNCTHSIYFPIRPYSTDGETCWMQLRATYV